MLDLSRSPQRKTMQKKARHEVTRDPLIRNSRGERVKGEEQAKVDMITLVSFTVNYQK